MFSKTCVYCIAKGEYCGFTKEAWDAEITKREIAEEWLERAGL